MRRLIILAAAIITPSSTLAQPLPSSPEFCPYGQTALNGVSAELAQDQSALSLSQGILAFYKAQLAAANQLQPVTFFAPQIDRAKYKVNYEYQMVLLNTQKVQADQEALAIYTKQFASCKIAPVPTP